MGSSPIPIPRRREAGYCITGNHGPLDPDEFEILAGVQEAIRVTRPYKLVSREVKPVDLRSSSRRPADRGPRLAIIAGPCAVDRRPRP